MAKYLCRHSLRGACVYSHHASLPEAINSATPPAAVQSAANGNTITNQAISFEIDVTAPIEPDGQPYMQEIEITGGTPAAIELQAM